MFCKIYIGNDFEIISKIHNGNYIIHNSIIIKMNGSIEGNIGSGKTKLLNRLKDILKNDINHFIDEPVDDFINPDIYNPIKNEFVSALNLFYEDKEKYGLLFQIFALNTIIIKITENISKSDKFNIYLSERSIKFSKNIFFKYYENNYEIFKVNSIENSFINNIYNQLYIFYKSLYKKHGYIIYVLNTPENCCKNTNERGRNEESNIPLSYFKDIHEYHEKYIKKLNDKDGPIIYYFDNTGNTNESFEEELQKLIIWMKMILNVKD